MNNIIITLIGIGSFIIGAAASAGIAALLWHKKEMKELSKKTNRIADIKREMEAFGEPTAEHFGKVNSKTIAGIAHKLELNDYLGNDIDGYGCLARKYSILLLREIAECMKEGESFADLVNRIKYDGLELM